jgi:hypothetical protein
MKRRLIDRIHDRTWHEAGRVLSRQSNFPALGDAADTCQSVSGSMPWASFCEAFADERISSANFRRTSAVRHIVETVGPVDGQFYAGRISQWAPEFLINSQVETVDTWGDPIRWPGWLLGTRRAFSPTTLRYLATAIWLKQKFQVTPDTAVTEIGVGFGGLAAMNALVSGAVTTLVDLPQVERTAMRMLDETGMGQHARMGHKVDPPKTDLIISNYAFTELSSELQSKYFTQYIKSSTHGVIISNAAIFAPSIRGRCDDDLVSWFNHEGVPAKITTTNEILGPSDHLCSVSLIYW